MKTAILAATIISAIVAAPAIAAETSKSPLMDKFAKFFYETSATKQAQPFPLTNEELEKITTAIKKSNAERGIVLDDRQALFMAGASSLFGSRGYPVTKAADHLRKAKSQDDSVIPTANKPKWLPEFDIAAHCEKMSQQMDGGAFMENSCRKQEQRALEAVLEADVSEKTGKHCARMAQQTDGGYFMLKACIDQEQRSLKEMGK